MIQAELGLPTPRMRTRDRYNQALRRPHFFPLFPPTRGAAGFAECVSAIDFASTSYPAPEKPDLTGILMDGVGAIVWSVVDGEFTSCVMDDSFSKEAGCQASRKYKKCKGFQDNKKHLLLGVFYNIVCLFKSSSTVQPCFSVYHNFFSISDKYRSLNFETIIELNLLGYISTTTITLYCWWS